MIIGTPDHWHVPLVIDALAAGKHVYCEKPLTHRIEEGEAVIAAQAKHPELVVQVGMQQRSMPQFLKAYDIIRGGALGEICKVHLTWNRNADRGPKGTLRHRSQVGRLEAIFGDRSAINRSTNTASAIGAGSGISAAESLPI